MQRTRDSATRFGDTEGRPVPGVPAHGRAEPFPPARRIAEPIFDRPSAIAEEFVTSPLCTGRIERPQFPESRQIPYDGVVLPECLCQQIDEFGRRGRNEKPGSVTPPILYQNGVAQEKAAPL